MTSDDWRSPTQNHEDDQEASVIKFVNQVIWSVQDRRDGHSLERQDECAISLPH